MQSPNEIWLSLDLSTRNGTLALFRAEGSQSPSMIGDVEQLSSGNHSEELLSKLDAYLKRHSLDLKQLSRLICSQGPGSFTGLRIGLATLKAIAYVTKKPLELVSSSEARGLEAIQRFSIQTFPIHVYTQIAASSHTVGVLEENGAFHEDNRELDLTSAVAIVDSEKLRLEKYTRSFVLSSSAEILAKHLLKLKSRKTITTQEELIVATPNYFGTSRF